MDLSIGLFHLEFNEDGSFIDVFNITNTKSNFEASLFSLNSKGEFDILFIAGIYYLLKAK